MQSYAPFGETATSIGGFDTDYGYTGEQIDVSGLIYLRARYYDPGTGRFLSQDTWEGDQYLPYSYNKWAYAYANPIRYTDPSGRFVGIAAAMLAGAASGLVSGMIAGAVFGACTYDWAIAGECGCSMQQRALSMTRWQWIGMNTLSGGIIGAVFGAIAATGPIGLIIVGASSIALSISDLVPAIRDIQTVGFTPCMITRIFIDILGIVFGASSIAKGVTTWKATGSAIRVSGTKAPSPSDIPSIRQKLSSLAAQAKKNIGDGRGPQYGIKVHTEFAKLINQLGLDILQTEISYRNRSVVNRGEPGSIRVDVVFGNPEKPIAIFDLKTGGATLTEARIQQIQAELPIQNVPVYEIKP